MSNDSHTRPQKVYTIGDDKKAKYNFTIRTGTYAPRSTVNFTKS